MGMWNSWWKRQKQSRMKKVIRDYEETERLLADMKESREDWVLILGEKRYEHSVEVHKRYLLLWSNTYWKAKAFARSESR